MAKCAVCGKAAHFGNNVSHSHRKSNRMCKTFIFDEETNKKTVLFYRAVFFVVLTGSKTDCSR